MTRTNRNELAKSFNLCFALVAMLFVITNFLANE